MAETGAAELQALCGVLSQGRREVHWRNHGVVFADEEARVKYLEMNDLFVI